MNDALYTIIRKTAAVHCKHPLTFETLTKSIMVHHQHESTIVIQNTTSSQEAAKRIIAWLTRLHGI